METSWLHGRLMSLFPDSSRAMQTFEVYSAKSLGESDEKPCLLFRKEALAPAKARAKTERRFMV
jgi:hypothetical protein